MVRLPQNQQQRFTQWTWSQERAFEEAIAIFPENMPEAERWQRVATHVPDKTPTEIKEHYHAMLEYSQRVATHVPAKLLTEINEHHNALLHHLCQVESGRVELPGYSDDSASAKVEVDDNSSKRTTPVERKKRLTWTEEEHRLFLIGLDKYGKGGWKSISRNVVKSKTATQIASHAQKYFIRQGFPKKERKRTSIHDISIEGIGLGDQLDSHNVPMQEPQAQQILQNCFYPPNIIPVQQLHTTEIMKNLVHAPPSAPMQQAQEIMQNMFYPPDIPMHHQLHTTQLAEEIMMNLVHAHSASNAAV